MIPLTVTNVFLLQSLFCPFPLTHILFSFYTSALLCLTLPLLSHRINFISPHTLSFPSFSLAPCPSLLPSLHFQFTSPPLVPFLNSSLYDFFVSSILSSTYLTISLYFFLSQYLSSSVSVFLSLIFSTFLFFSLYLS